MARLALVTVSSSRTTMSPALTRSPSRARTSPTTPPVGCCTFLTLDSTTIWPGAISAPEICCGRGPAAEPAGQHHDDREADDQMQPDRAPRALHVLAASSWPTHRLMTWHSASETILIGVGRGDARLQHLRQHLLLRTEGLHAAVLQHQDLIDRLDADRPVRDHDDDGAALARARAPRASAPRRLRYRDWNSARRARSGTDRRRARAPAPRAAPGRPTAPCPARRPGCRSRRAS